MSKLDELRENFIKNILKDLEETYSFDRKKKMFRNDNAQQMAKTYGNTQWVYYDNDIKHFAIPYRILPPSTNKLLNTPDFRYLLKCTDDNLFFIPDSYLDKQGYLKFDEHGNFIPLDQYKLKQLLSTFEFMEYGQLKIKDPICDLHFVNANDKASIKKS